MARTDTLENFLTDVADAIRSKKGTSGTISASSFDTEIESITGGGTEISLQEKTITPTTSSQNVTADSGYGGLSKVTINAVTSAIDSDIKATNIRKGVNILGVNGTMEEYVEPTLQSKSATPKTTAQTITADSSYDGLSSVSISAVTSSIDSNIKAENIKSGVSILGVTGTLEEGGSSSGEDDLFNSLANRTITEVSNSNLTLVGDYAFYNCKKLVSVNLPNATTINTAAFRGCTSLSEINIPNVVSIGTNVFMNCSSITEMSLSGVSTINTSLFYSCTSLESVNFPDATSVKNDAFRGCTKLKTVEIPSVTSINAQAFLNCSALEKIILNSETVCTLANVNAFNGSSIANGTGYVYVRDTLLEEYKNYSNWSTYAAQIKGVSELSS